MIKLAPTLIAFLLGSLLGVWQYLPDLQAGLVSLNTDGSDSREDYEGLDEKTQSVVERSVDLDALMALSPPRHDAPVDEWVEFLGSVNNIPMPRGQRGARYSPLMVWYAYVARHRPEALYALYGTQTVNYGTIDHLVQSGFIQDWYHSIPPDSGLLLYSNTANLSYALGVGADARRNMAGYWLAALSGRERRRLPLGLDQLPFAMGAMSDEEIETLMPHLLAIDAQIDPRDIRFLVQTGRFERADLLALMRKHAYTDKSMFGFVTMAMRLGAEEYVPTLIADMPDKSGEPIDWYCPPCAFALVADGLVGRRLMEAAAAQRLSVDWSPEGGYELTSTETPPSEDPRPEDHHGS